MKKPLNGTPTLNLPLISDDVLRKMNHTEWLRDFSAVIGLQAPGSPPMTPMRQGAMQRLRLAAEYIELLDKDLRISKERVKDADKLLAQATAAIRRLKDQRDAGEANHDDTGR